MKIINKVKKVFSIDARALSIFRICLALILIFDLLVRSFALVAHYTDFGALPTNFYFETYKNSDWISVHLLSGSVLFQSVLFIVAGIFAIALLLGYKTRLATIVSWFLLISLQSRNPTVLQGGDIMLRMLMFWAMFLPLNIRYSLDRLLEKVKENKKDVFSFGTVGMLLQIAFVYFFSALLKTGNEWIPNGTAIYYSLQIDQFATYFGKFLLGFPEIMFGMTYFVYFIELAGPILLFSPFFFKQIRIMITFAFLLVLSGMALSMHLGHFPFVGIVAFILFLPSLFWDKLSNKIKFLRNKMVHFHELQYLKKNNKMVFINCFALFFIIYILLWNVQTLGKFNAVPDKAEFIAHYLRVDQYWNMFAPYPLKDDGWYVIDGALADGRHINLLTYEGVNFDKPKHVADLYSHERWRKYLMNLWQQDYSHHRPYFLNYLCNSWNSKYLDEEKLIHIDMNFMLEMTKENYQIEESEKIVLDSIDLIVIPRPSGSVG